MIFRIRPGRGRVERDPCRVTAGAHGVSVGEGRIDRLS